LRLVGRTLAKHPRVNGSWVDNGIRLNPEINVAIAMAVEDGVVAAVIRDADSASLGEIAKQRRELTDRARAGRLRYRNRTSGSDEPPYARTCMPSRRGRGRFDDCSLQAPQPFQKSQKGVLTAGITTFPAKCWNAAVEGRRVVR
jgi:hypothetical protein